MTGRLYCVCRKKAGSGRFMIGCDKCGEWFHMTCVGVKRNQKLPSKWFCKKCLPSKSVRKAQQNKSSPSFHHNQQLQAKLKVQEEQLSSVQQLLNAMQGAMEDNKEKLAALTSQLSDTQAKDKIIDSLLQQLGKKEETVETLTSQIYQLKERLTMECKESSTLRETLRKSEEKHQIQLQSKEQVIASLQKQFDNKVTVETLEPVTSQINELNPPSTNSAITPFEGVQTNQLVPKNGHTFLLQSTNGNAAKKLTETNSSQESKAHKPMKRNENVSKRGSLSLSLQKRANLSVKKPSKPSSQPAPTFKSRYDLADEDDFKSLS